MAITLKYVEQHGFQMFIDDIDSGEPTHVGDICPSGDAQEWAAYTLTASGRIATPRLSTSTDLLDVMDDLEANYFKNKESK
jgi:hypothetical protein